MATTGIEVNEQQMDAVYAVMSGIKDGATRAINGALNDTASQAKTKAVTAVYTELNLTKKVINNHTKVWKSTFTTLKAYLRISGKPLPLADPSVSSLDRIGPNYYKASVLKLGKGVSATIRRGELERYGWMFKARMPSGHVGIFQRNLRTPRREARANLWGSTGLPIETPIGPSVASVFEHHGYNGVVLSSPDDLQTNLDKQIARILARYV